MLNLMRILGDGGEAALFSPSPPANHVWRSATKVLHMPRTGSCCRILPRPEDFLDSVLRAVSDPYPTGPPSDGLNTPIISKRDLQVPSMRSLQRVLGSKRSPLIGLSSVNRVRATTTEVYTESPTHALAIAPAKLSEGGPKIISAGAVLVALFLASRSVLLVTR